MKIVRFLVALCVVVSLESFSFLPAGVDTASVSVSDNSAYMSSLYSDLELDVKGLSYQAFELALRGMKRLVEEGTLSKCDIITVADMSQSSNQKRLYVINLDAHQLLLQTYVAHGRNSGEEFAGSFSNVSGSNQSSLGFYVTLDAYDGDNGLSLRLAGMEPGINDNAYDRAIVIHGADYVSPAFIAENGRLGRSLGCPAVSVKENGHLIEILKEGSCLFVYYPDVDYMIRSELVN